LASVAFEEAMNVFGDPLACSILDPDRGAGEERWITLGQTSTGNLLLVVHTWVDIDSERSAVRIPKRGSPVSRGSNTMRDEYDFSNAERGKFHRADALLVPPVHLEAEVLAFLRARAEARGVSLSELVNALLKKDIELIEAAE
jgi:hypothetical protein